MSTKRQHNATADTIRALAGLVVALRHGDSFAITRLTRIKRLCADPQAAAEFARFIARRAQAALRDRSRPERVAPEQWEHYRTLANVGVVQLDAYLADPTAAQATALREAGQYLVFDTTRAIEGVVDLKTSLQCVYREQRRQLSTLARHERDHNALAKLSYAEMAHEPSGAATVAPR